MENLTAKDVEKNISSEDKRLDVCLMGLSYDIIKKNKGIKSEQLSLLAGAQMQKKDPAEFGLYKYTQDKKASGFKLSKVDWSSALAQYSQNKIAEWVQLASDRGMSMQDYLLDNISKNLILGYHSAGHKIVDAGLNRLLSADCSKAASDNFDAKEKSVKSQNGFISIDAVKKTLGR